jgi:phage-related protein
VKPKSSSLAVELILYLIAAAIMLTIIYAVIYDRSALAPAGQGVLSSFFSIFSSIANGIVSVIDDIVHAIISFISNSLSSVGSTAYHGLYNAGTYLYKHTIGAL